MSSEIKVVLLTDKAQYPGYKSAGAAGADLYSTDELYIPVDGWRVVCCGIRIAIPEGFEGQIRPRSGMAAEHGVTVLNAPGTIDSDYRGEVRVILINHGPNAFKVSVGDRIAQLVIAPVARATFVDSEQLFGSTGV